MTGPVGGPARTATRSTTHREVLAEASSATRGRFAPDAGRDGRGRAGDGGWLHVRQLLDRPQLLEPLVLQVGHRFGSDDRALVLAQVTRESAATLTAAAVHTWSRQRRLPDLTAANVLLREGDGRIEVGLVHTDLTVLADDPLAAAPGAEVVDEATMLARLLDTSLGHPSPVGRMPAGGPDRVAAVAAVIATVRRLVTSGDRHLWGTAALAVASTLAASSHTDPDQATRDLATVFAARPDLASTVELITVDDDDGAPLTFGRRRTCCLLYKLRDGTTCGTCSLRDHDDCAAALAEWYRAQRRERRGAAPDRPAPG